MSSSAMPIELSAATDVRVDDSTLTVALADGRVIVTPLDWYPRLAFGTADERADWELTADGEGIHWPALDEDVSVAGLIAGRKSAEGAPSLKRWMAIQDQLRRTTGFRELRRDVMRTGPLPASVIRQRVASEVEAYDSRPGDWSVAVVGGDPFAALGRLGVAEAHACTVYQAASAADALAAKDECVRAGMVPAGLDDGPPVDQVAYLTVYSAAVK